MPPDLTDDATLRVVVRDLTRRVEVIERYEPAVLAERVKVLAGEVRGLRRGFYTFAFSVVGGSVLFAISMLVVFQ